MPKTSVFTPMLDDGLPSINFFNGRLLSAEDLKTERSANREGHHRLGHAIGDGVVSGLEVRAADGSTADAPAVTVTAGLAIARTGHAIQLHTTTDVSLLTSTPAAGTAEVTTFKYCKPPRTGTYVAGAGVYLLAITSTSGGKGLAPTSGLGNQIADCNTKYWIEGIEFLLIPIAADSLLGEPDTLRNRLAYSCFGVDRDASLAADPLRTSTSGDPVSKLRDARTLTDCDVPLAVIYWTNDGIQFVDMWAARRTPAVPVGGTLGELVHLRQTTEGEARLLQFQTQLAELVGKSASPSTLDVRTTFAYLPPVAFLPITGVREDRVRLRPVAASARRALDYERFFGNRVRSEPLVIEGACVGPLIRESLASPPIDVKGEQMFWLYVVRENMQAVESGTSAVPYMIAASPHLRFQADARFDVSQWNYSNYV